MSKTLRFQKLSAAITHLDEAARLLQSLGDPVIDHEVMRHLEGNPCGWEGRLLRDILEERREAFQKALLEE